VEAPDSARLTFGSCLCAVTEGLARLRATVTAAHDPSEIERAMDVIGEAGKKLGIIKRESREERARKQPAIATGCFLALIVSDGFL